MLAFLIKPLFQRIFKVAWTLVLLVKWLNENNSDKETPWNILTRTNTEDHSENFTASLPTIWMKTQHAHLILFEVSQQRLAYRCWIQ